MKRLLPAYAVLVVALFGCAQGSQGPTASSTAVLPPSPSPGAQLNAYENDLFRFSYPADWRILAEEVSARHYEWIPVVVGTGAWKLNCSTFSTNESTTVTCGEDIFDVGPSDVVVELHFMDTPAHIEQTPPPHAEDTSGGLVASLTRTGSRAKWAVYGIPGWAPPLIVEAELGATSVALDDVGALVESITLMRPPGMVVPVPVAEPGTSRDCASNATGNLIAHDEWGIAFWDDADVIRQAIWPDGFSGLIVDDGRLALVDVLDEIVAYEHDLIDITGSEAAGTWTVCAVVNKSR